MSSDTMVNSEITDGYRDGLDPNCPEPSAQRTQSYCYGFLNGREDLRRSRLPCHSAPPHHAKEELRRSDTQGREPQQPRLGHVLAG